MSQRIVFKLENADTAMARKTAALFKRIVRERINVPAVGKTGDGVINVIGSIEPGIGREGYRIQDDPDGAIRISGNDERGLLYGVGRFLRETDFQRGRVRPCRWRGSEVPTGEVRGIYFATHFHNFYHDAPISAVQRYVEELALWGCNALLVWFDMHHYRGLRDPAAAAMIHRLRLILKAAEAVGITPGLTLLANEAYADSPRKLRADWTAGHDGYHAPPGGHYHVEICPNKPGGLDAIVKARRAMLRTFKGIDIGYAMIWPYDQGGCTCTACAPWGSNGYLKAAQPVAQAVKDLFPKAQIVLSTWYFDHFTQGEWPGLATAFKRRKPAWVDYLLVDDSGDRFPEYPIRNGVPGGFPMVNFTEISMYNLWPWGAYGANPLARHLQQIWDVSGMHLAGGFPYSEGIFEDINKAVMLGFFWNRACKAEDTLVAYIGGYFGLAHVREIAEAIALLEANHPGRSAGYYLDGQPVYPWNRTGKPAAPYEIRYGTADAAGTRRAASRFRTLDRKLSPAVRRSWRWRILFLRALLDDCLARSRGRPTPEAEAYFDELIAIFHAKNAELTVSPASLKALQRAWPS